jgi:hypothetical protein
MFEEDRLRKENDALKVIVAQKEQQKVFYLPSKNQGMILGREGLLVMQEVGRKLFPSRPHNGIPRCCRCEECKEYYGE